MIHEKSYQKHILSEIIAIDISFLVIDVHKCCSKPIFAKYSTYCIEILKKQPDDLPYSSVKYFTQRM